MGIWEGGLYPSIVPWGSRSSRPFATPDQAVPELFPELILEPRCCERCQVITRGPEGSRDRYLTPLVPWEFQDLIRRTPLFPRGSGGDSRSEGALTSKSGSPGRVLPTTRMLDLPIFGLPEQVLLLVCLMGPYASIWAVPLCDEGAPRHSEAHPFPHLAVVSLGLSWSLLVSLGLSWSWGRRQHLGADASTFRDMGIGEKVQSPRLLHRA